ncbi:hypothetical protein [Nonomuraea gerenzanensis]|uniref:hypothetical protein n=1 Tax=Nonomuraea gerenzanensis TaxID=93944 RepID=UPI001CD9EEAF|nr:hypothetical protein [Nonomuraea gerenzanensis]UBU10178.1 hypothetical protein LCN96_38310 [Nonomuraea gerenzanensis]
MESEVMAMAVVGAVCFGLVIGWIAYGTLRRRRAGNGVTELAAVLAAVGGGLVTALLGLSEVFGGYAVGLAVGFFGYLALVTLVPGSPWAGEPVKRPTDTYDAQRSGSVEP